MRWRVNIRGLLAGFQQTGEQPAGIPPLWVLPNTSPPAPDAGPQHTILHGSTTNSLLSPNTNTTTLKPSESCSICQEPLHELHAAGTAIVTTTCGHHFCSSCINGHLDYHAQHNSRVTRCPNCNQRWNTRCPNCNQRWNIVWDPDGHDPRVQQPPVQLREGARRRTRRAERARREMRRARRWERRGAVAGLPPLVAVESVRRERDEQRDDDLVSAYIVANLELFWPPPV